MTYCDWGSEKTLAGKRRGEGRSRGAAVRESWRPPPPEAARREIRRRARRPWREQRVSYVPELEFVASAISRFTLTPAVMLSLSLVPCGIRLIACGSLLYGLTALTASWAGLYKKSWACFFFFAGYVGLGYSEPFGLCLLKKKKAFGICLFGSAVRALTIFSP